MTHYYNGFCKIKVLRTRAIDKENFSPMVHRMLDSGHLSDCIQVEIDSGVLGIRWITVRRDELKIEGETE